MDNEATVFIVDDDEGVREGLGLLLETIGQPYELYGSAIEFLEAYDPSRRGCLVLDIRMPRMSGLDLQEKLNKQDSLLPIIFITGHGDIPMAVDAMRRGVKVRRRGWNGKGMFIVLMEGLQLPPYNTQGTARKVNDRTAKWIGEDTPLDSQPYIALWNAQGKWQPGWAAAQSDLLGNDWEIAE